MRTCNAWKNASWPVPRWVATYRGQALHLYIYIINVILLICSSAIMYHIYQMHCVNFAPREALHFVCTVCLVLEPSTPSVTIVILTMCPVVTQQTLNNNNTESRKATQGSSYWPISVEVWPGPCYKQEHYESTNLRQGTSILPRFSVWRVSHLVTLLRYQIPKDNHIILSKQTAQTSTKARLQAESSLKLNHVLVDHFRLLHKISLQFVHTFFSNVANNPPPPPPKYTQK